MDELQIAAALQARRLWSGDANKLKRRRRRLRFDVCLYVYTLFVQAGFVVIYAAEQQVWACILFALVAAMMTDVLRRHLTLYRDARNAYQHCLTMIVSIDHQLRSEELDHGDTRSN